jgi:hypothetical protein
MIEIDSRGVAELSRVLDGKSRQVRQQISSAINETATFVAKRMSQEIRKELNVKAKDIKKSFKMSSRATKDLMRRNITLTKDSRLSLKYFGARQTKRGVSYQTSVKRGRKTIQGAFMGPRPGQLAPKLNGHVFKRVGEARKPIARLEGASPWGAFVINKLQAIVVTEGQSYLNKKIQQRTKFLQLKKAGLIPAKGN